MLHKHRFLCVFILIAFALRLTRLDGPSLWYDEGVTWWLARTPSPLALIRWTAADIQPPLYYLLIWLATRVFGDSEYALRWPSVIFNILTIPLLYHLSENNFPKPHRFLKPVRFELLPAFILTISPIMVYYSQEARMYTLLVWEATFASYLLLRIVRKKNRLEIILYVITATAALYTHYFAAFLLVAHFLYMFMAESTKPDRLLKICMIFGCIALFFAPWLPILFSRLGDDPSYWVGTLKLNEAIRKIFISFTVGETVFEQTGFWLAIGYLGFLIFDFGLNLKSKLENPNSKIIFLWLFVPITLILALSYVSPKFNPRYTLLAWPAFALLWGNSFKPNKFQKYVRFVFYIFLIATSFFSLHNWFTDPRFSKTDFRAVAQFIKERRVADETVLLSSGHFFPVWAYYYGETGWTSLPKMERLDVQRVTDLNISTDLRQALAGYGGAWLVNWQDEVIDPNRVVPFWLDLIGERPHDAGDFWGVRLEHWRLKKPALLSQSPIKQAVQFNFNHWLDLVGLTQLNDTELVLFWQARQPLPDKLIVTLELTDKNNFTWHNERLSAQLGSFFYPTVRWQVGQTVLTRHTLPWRLGTPPGVYIAAIRVGQILNGSYQAMDILDTQGHPQRRTALLPPISLSHLIEKNSQELPLLDLPFGKLYQSTLSHQQIEPGDRLGLALLWQIQQSDVPFTFELVDANHQILPIENLVGQASCLSFMDRQDACPTGKVLNQYWLDIPPHTAPGLAMLQLHLKDKTTNSIVPFTKLEILSTTRNFIVPKMDISLQADFSGQTTMLGFDCWADCQTSPDGNVTLTFYWRGETQMEQNYTIFAHLLSGQETVIIAADHPPLKPTRSWAKGEIISDTITMTIPPTMSPGRYAFELGLYNAADPTFPRLPLSNGETRVLLPNQVVVK